MMKVLLQQDPRGRFGIGEINQGRWSVWLVVLSPCCGGQMKLGKRVDQVRCLTCQGVWEGKKLNNSFLRPSFLLKSSGRSPGASQWVSAWTELEDVCVEVTI